MMVFGSKFVIKNQTTTRLIPLDLSRQVERTVSTHSAVTVEKQKGNSFAAFFHQDRLDALLLFRLLTLG